MTMVQCSVACISGLDGRATVKQLLDCQLHKPVAVFSLNCRSPRQKLLSLPGIMTEVTSTTSGNHNQSHGEVWWRQSSPLLQRSWKSRSIAKQHWPTRLEFSSTTCIVCRSLVWSW